MYTLTSKPLNSSIDAVAAPLTIKFESNASGVSAALGMLNNASPLPLKYPLPDGMVIFPKNVEPLSIDSTINPPSGLTDAVTEPLDNLIASTANSDAGKLVSCEPSPANEPLNEPLNSLAVTISVTFTLPVTSTCPSNLITGVEYNTSTTEISPPIDAWF